MPEGTYELVQAADGYIARITARGHAVLATPTINRGTAFTLAERRELGLTGLLPSGVSTLDAQLRRTYAQYREQANDLRKWVYLANLRDRNEVLFDEANDRIIGAGIVGPNAGDLIAEAALAIEIGADAADIGLTIHPHPTLSETVAMAAEAFEGTITDLYMPKKK